jgi:hypothetical protein
MGAEVVVAAAVMMMYFALLLSRPTEVWHRYCHHSHYHR